MTEARPTRRDLVIVRRFAASPERLFAAFLEHDALTAWWAPRGWIATRVSIDPRVGGRYSMAMRSVEDPSEMELRGEYVIVDPPRALRFTYVWQPGGAGERWREVALTGVVTIVDLRFRAFDGGTELTLRHEGFPDPRGAEAHEGGWSSCLECLDDFVVHGVAKRLPSPPH